MKFGQLAVELEEKFKGSSSCWLSQGHVKNGPPTSLHSLCPAVDFTFSRVPRVQTHLMSKNARLCYMAKFCLACSKMTRTTQIVEMARISLFLNIFVLNFSWSLPDKLPQAKYVHQHTCQSSVPKLSAVRTLCERSPLACDNILPSCF